MRRVQVFFLLFAILSLIHVFCSSHGITRIGGTSIKNTFVDSLESMAPGYSNFIKDVHRSTLEKKPVDVPDVPPYPIGGFNSIKKNLHYPKTAKQNNIRGRVLVYVTIDSSGEIIKTKILKKLGYGCEEAALSTLKQVKFVPAYLDNKRVEGALAIPFDFN